jgi:hypothetical protein
LSDLPLTAAMPASLRAPGDTRMNNQLTFLLCRLAELSRFDPWFGDFRVV